MTRGRAGPGCAGCPGPPPPRRGRPSPRTGTAAGNWRPGGEAGGFKRPAATAPVPEAMASGAGAVSSGMPVPDSPLRPAGLRRPEGYEAFRGAFPGAGEDFLLFRALRGLCLARARRQPLPAGALSRSLAPASLEAFPIPRPGPGPPWPCPASSGLRADPSGNSPPTHVGPAASLSRLPGLCARVGRKGGGKEIPPRKPAASVVNIPSVPRGSVCRLEAGRAPGRRTPEPALPSPKRSPRAGAPPSRGKRPAPEEAT